MMDLARIRRNVERMLRRFPSRRAGLYRPIVDAYGQPTPDETLLGSVEIWMEGANRPGRWVVRDGGAEFDDEGARWGCLLWSDELPRARHGDIVRFEDGETFVVRNIANDANIRVFWQLDRVERDAHVGV